MRIDNIEIFSGNLKLGIIVESDGIFHFIPDEEVSLNSSNITRVASIMENLDYFCVQNDLNVGGEL